MTKIWLGRWLMAVAAAHTGFALVVFPRQLLDIALNGFWGGVVRDPSLAAVTWFVLFGALLLIVGLALSTMEKKALPIPLSIGWLLLGLTVLGIALMPRSGFYLVLVPAMAILARRPRGHATA
jgi:Family of unknown function (DUF6463)